MSVIVLRLAGPMQSWGLQSRFHIRDTASEPTKSGIIGLLSAAIGRERDADVSDLNSLKMAIRIDREGIVQRDYQTAGGGLRPDGSDYGVAKSSGASRNPVVSERYYLADADFRVALETSDTSLARMLADALKSPIRPCYLGRRAYLPSVPVFRALHDRESAVGVLEDSEPWYARTPRERDQHGLGIRVRSVVEVVPGSIGEDYFSDCDVRQDIISRFDTREFRLRYVKNQWVNVPPTLIVEDPLCFYRP